MVIFATLNLLALITKQVHAHLPSKWGNFDIVAYAESADEAQPHLALIHQPIDFNSVVPVRIHSECLTGDLFGSKRCDCGEQLDLAMKMISQHGGILIYLRQEGRGIGLINKLKAYNLQDSGLDTIEANVHLGFEPDERDFDLAIDILRDLKVKKIDLITNNPQKLDAIHLSDIYLNKRIPIVIPSKNENEAYLKVKQRLMGHLLS